MAAGDLITKDGQHELQGVLFGRDTDLRVSEYGTWGTPPYKAADTSRPQEHGDFASGSDFLEAREVPYDVVVRGDTPSEVLDNLHELGAAFAPVDDGLVDLVWQDEGTKYLMRGRPRGIDPPGSVKAKQVGHLKVRGRFRAHEALILSHATEGVSTSLGSKSGGLDLDHGFPHGFGSATAGTSEGTNDGKIAAPWTGVVTAGAGGLTNPRITLVETAEYLQFDLTLTEGQTLEIDVLAREALLNGVASRTGKRHVPGSTWFKLPPGDWTLQFTGSGAGTFLPTARSAWAT